MSLAKPQKSEFREIEISAEKIAPVFPNRNFAISMLFCTLMLDFYSLVYCHVGLFSKTFIYFLPPIIVSLFAVLNQCISKKTRFILLTFSVIIAYINSFSLHLGFRISFTGFFRCFFSSFIMFPRHSLINAILIIGTLISLNKSNRKAAILFSSILILYYAGMFLKYLMPSLRSSMGFLGYYNTVHNRIFGYGFENTTLNTFFDLCGFISQYAELVVPVVLFCCAVNPKLIHGSIKCLVVTLAVMLVTGIAWSFKFCSKQTQSFTNELYLTFLYESWVPLIAIFGLNSVLLFPIPLKSLLKTFRSAFFVTALIAVYAAASSAASDAQDKREQQAAQEREAFLQNNLEAINSWREGGFSADFSIEMAQQLLNEGRITTSEYGWLIANLKL